MKDSTNYEVICAHCTPPSTDNPKANGALGRGNETALLRSLFSSRPLIGVLLLAVLGIAVGGEVKVPMPVLLLTDYIAANFSLLLERGSAAGD